MAPMELALQDVVDPRDLLGGSLPMRRLGERIAKVARTDCRCLIVGESGSGKELVAEAIHRLSRRRGGPFVAVRCGAIPQGLFDSELYGVVGASGGVRRGRLDAAEGGTLLLDELDEMPLFSQVKLLRVLNAGRFEREGGHVERESDVRVIASTSKDPRELVRQGRLRQDLYYRLDIVTLELPPLRDRRADIPALAEHFAAEAADRHGLKPAEITAGAHEQLGRYGFPGNVRELQTLMERAVILGEGRPVTAATLRRLLPVQRSAGDASLYRPGHDLKALLGAAEKQILQDALRAHGSNTAVAARALGMERSHFSRKCRAYGIGEARVAQLVV